MLPVIIICIIPSLIPALWVTIRCTADKRKIALQTFVGVFFSCATMLALIKMILGEGELNLFDSFVDAILQTYVHYLVPGVLGAIIMSLICDIIVHRVNNKEFFANLLSDFVSAICVLSGLCIFFFSEITNEILVGIYIISILLTFICSFVVNLHKRSFDETIFSYGQFFLVLTFIVFMNYVFFPGNLYLGNVSDMSITMDNWEKSMYFNALTILIVFGVVGRIIVDKWWLKLGTTSFFLLGICEYIQSLFLNNHLGSMDGTSADWGVNLLCANICVWVLLASVVVLYVYRFDRKHYILGYIALCIALVQVMTFITLRLTTPVDREEQYILSTQDMFDVSGGDNVIVFVLDWFDGQFIDMIDSSDGEYLKPLHDFIYYENMTSRYAYTASALPYLLSGVECKEGMSEREYASYAYASSTLLSDMKQAGNCLRFYTYPDFLPSNAEELIDNYMVDYDGQKVDMRKLGKIIQKTTRFTALPYIIKNRYAYTEGEIEKCISDNEKNYVCNDDVVFYNKLVDDSVDINPELGDKAFTFYHLYGAHVPVLKNAECEYDYDATLLEQSKGALKIVYEYIEKLKKSGKYDNATIIITADHGQNLSLDYHGFEELKGYGLNSATSNPILFVKLPGQKSETLTVSDAPVSQQELVGTIRNQTLDKSVAGDTLESVKEDSKRIRTLTVFRGNVPWHEYTIDGNVKDISDWSPNPELQQ